MTLFTMDKFVAKEKKKQSQICCQYNCKRSRKKLCTRSASYMYWSILSSCFDRLANGVIFPAEFCVFFLQVRRDSLANFRAQIARENLRREKGVEGI